LAQERRGRLSFEIFTTIIAPLGVLGNRSAEGNGWTKGRTAMEGRSRRGAAGRGWATNLFVRAEWEIDLGNPALPRAGSAVSYGAICLMISSFSGWSGRQPLGSAPLRKVGRLSDREAARDDAG